MAVTDNTIGDFDFLTLRGNVNAPAMQLVLDQRIGVDGTEVTRTGKRATPSVLTSTRDVATGKAGRKLYREYLDLVDDNPVEVVKDGLSSLDNAGWKAQVLEVRLVILQAITAAVGGIEEDPPGAILVCEWAVIAIAN